MTMILPSSLRQPNKKDYLDALSNEYKWPFWLRATIINKYRKLMRPTHSSAVEPAIDNREVVGSNPSASTKKLKPRYIAKPRKQHSMKKNYVTVRMAYVIIRYKSTGKNRPFKKIKYQFARRNLVLWLKGNKHNGGHRVDL